MFPFFGGKFQLLPDSASNFASQVDLLTLFLTAVSVVITLVLCGLIAYFGIRYRRRSENEVPPYEEHGPLVEWGLSAFLFFVMMIMFGWGTKVYVDMKTPAVNAIEINVIGKQWMWKVQQPGGQKEINELHVPIGRPVKLVMTSQDVIHSFGLPAFRIKQDVVPGAFSTQWFTATKKGEYHLFCQEYCGTWHSQMGGRVVVMDEKDYEAWLASVPVDETPASAGAKLFTQYGCVQCHGSVAPTLSGLYGNKVKLEDGRTVTADEDYIRESILEPSAKIVAGYGHLMPTFKGVLNTEQVNTLVAYIESMGVARGDTAGANPGLDVGGPATQPVNGVVPKALPNIPPAQQPPGVNEPPAGVKRDLP